MLVRKSAAACRVLRCLKPEADFGDDNVAEKEFVDRSSVQEGNDALGWLRTRKLGNDVGIDQKSAHDSSSANVIGGWYTGYVRSGLILSPRRRASCMASTSTAPVRPLVLGACCWA